WPPLPPRAGSVNGWRFATQEGRIALSGPGTRRNDRAFNSIGCDGCDAARGRSRGQRMTADDEKLRRKLQGAWELVLWKNRRHDEDMDYPFGRDARGLLVYTADGHMSVQMVRPGVQPLGAPPASAPIEK